MKGLEDLEVDISNEFPNFNLNIFPERENILAYQAYQYILTVCLDFSNVMTLRQEG